MVSGLRATIAFLFVATLAASALANEAGDDPSGAVWVAIAPTPVYERLTKSSAVLDELVAGDEVEVYGRHGEWVLVEAHGQTGWLRVTSIERRLLAKRGWRGVSQDIVSLPLVAATTKIGARSRPKRKSPKLFRVERGAQLLVLAGKGKWLRVRDRTGRDGWVRRQSVVPVDAERAADGGSADDTDGVLTFEPTDEGPALARSRLARTGVAFDAGANVGLANHSRRFDSNGESALGGYHINASSMMLAVGGRARYRRRKVYAAAGARLATSVGAPGIRFQDDSGQLSEANRFYTHQASATVELGASVNESHPVEVAAVVGYQINYFIVDEIQNNPGLLARERIAGPTLGARMATDISARLLLLAQLDAQPVGRLRQTVNLEDGMESSVWAMGGGLSAIYMLDERDTVEVGYAVRRVSLEWNGQSTRQFDVTEASRVDFQHTFTVGAARAF